MSAIPTSPVALSEPGTVPDTQHHCFGREQGDVPTSPSTQRPPLPSFTGKVVDRETLPEEAFRVHAYQYAFTSETYTSMWPAAIVYVANDEDIQKAIQYARENDLGIAVRSGGHHYLGMSSTSGMNIQLDLSGNLAPCKAAYPYGSVSYESTANLLTMGAGTRMDYVSKVCADLGVFFPHGECATVHTGGHTQTGGYSVISRSFGLMADYIVSIDVILASGEKRTVRRDSDDPLDRDLLFALIGGSPGNFGVVTSTTVKVMRDVDHPHACAVKVAWLYNKDTMRELLRLVNEVNDDESTPLDLNVTVLAVGAQHTPNFHPTSWHSFDDEMAIKHPELTGKYGFNYVVPIVAFAASWTNLKGNAVSEVDPVSRRWIERFLSVRGTKLKTEFDHTMPMAVSVQLLRLLWENPREFSLPYVKRLYLGEGYTLTQPDVTDGKTLADWITERCDDVQGLWNLFRSRGLKLAMQVYPMGGGAFNNHPHRPTTALGARDCNYFLGLDVFYDPSVAGAKERATAWCDANDQAMLANRYHFRFRNPDTDAQRRVLWAPFTHGAEVANLDAQWKYYFDDEATYRRLLEIKAAVDPKSVFSPNLFCVGASRLSRFQHLLPSSCVSAAAVEEGTTTGELPEVFYSEPPTQVSSPTGESQQQHFKEAPWAVANQMDVPSPAGSKRGLAQLRAAVSDVPMVPLKQARAELCLPDGEARQ